MSLSRKMSAQKVKKQRRNRLKKRFKWLTVVGCTVIIGLGLWYGWPLLSSSLPFGDHAEVKEKAGEDNGGSGRQSSTNSQNLPPEATESEQPSSGPVVDPSEPDGSAPVNEEEPLHEQITMTFVGDVLLGNNVEPILLRNGYDYPYREVKSNLTYADITVANFESPVTLRGEPEEKTYVYRTSPEALPAFTEAGFDLVNLANNHILDYGQTGLLDTFQYLEEAGVSWVGAGHDADEAFRPVYIEKQGIKVAFLGFSRVVPLSKTISWKADVDNPGVADTYNHEKPIAAIEAAKQEADLVVVLAHWGQEKNNHPLPYQIDLAHRYIDAGADLIVGSHPHVLQGFERYKDKWIAYSLGNFIFTTNQNTETHKTIILDASCSKDGACDLQLTPIYTYMAQPVVMKPEEAAELREKLTTISFDTVVTDEGKVEYRQSSQ